MNVVSERPGVYSSYEASSVVSSQSGNKSVGLVAQCDEGTAGVLYEFAKYADAVTAFGEGEDITNLVYLLFLNGAAAVYAVAVEDNTDDDECEAAFSLLYDVDDITLMVCDSTTLTVQQALRDSVTAAASARRERIGIVSGGSEETVTQLIARAAGLNSERMVLVAPEVDGGTGAQLAAAVAGAIAAESDPAVPMGNAVLSGVTALSTRYEDSEVDLLIQGGVTPMEALSGQVSIIRGVTTRTTTSSVSDSTWLELTTILIVDDVIPAIRDSLKAKFSRSKNTEQSRSSIRSQVILELETKLSREIITSYGDVTATADESDPTVCVVEFSFTVAHGLNQIWLSAQITV